MGVRRLLRFPRFSVDPLQRLETMIIHDGEPPALCALATDMWLLATRTGQDGRAGTVFTVPMPRNIFSPTSGTYDSTEIGLGLAGHPADQAFFSARYDRRDGLFWVRGRTPAGACEDGVLVDYTRAHQILRAWVRDVAPHGLIALPAASAGRHRDIRPRTLALTHAPGGNG